jgi:hypothetical protein
MGIEKKNKKNPPYPGRLPKYYLYFKQKYFYYIVEVLLLEVEVALGEPAGVARRREDQPCKCKIMQIAKSIFS